MQLVSKVPALLVMRAKLPVGVIPVPCVDESVTVTVQVVTEPVLAGEGVQVMLVVDERRVAVKVVEPLLEAWVASPG